MRVRMFFKEGIMSVLTDWFKKYFSTEEAVALLVTIAMFGLLVVHWGHIFAPIFIGLIISYLLQQPINYLAKRMPYVTATVIIFSLFTLFVCGSMLVILPVCWVQLERLATELPAIASNIHKAVADLVATMGNAIPADTIKQTDGMLHQSTQNVTGEV